MMMICSKREPQTEYGIDECYRLEANQMCWIFRSKMMLAQCRWSHSKPQNVPTKLATQIALTHAHAIAFALIQTIEIKAEKKKSKNKPATTN